MPKRFGYWRFDGDSIDCEGEFVTMEEDENVSTERERLHKVWEEQLPQMKETKQLHKTRMKEAIAMSPRNDNTYLETTSQSRKITRRGPAWPNPSLPPTVNMQ
jgi:hypothetical protein